MKSSVTVKMSRAFKRLQRKDWSVLFKLRETRQTDQFLNLENILYLLNMPLGKLRSIKTWLKITNY